MYNFNYMTFWKGKTTLRVKRSVVTRVLEESWKKEARDIFSSVQSLSCVRLCDPMDCSMPGIPVHHQLLELAQTHVHWIGDAIQPFHPLSSPSPPALSLSQHQMSQLFTWGGWSIRASASASVLPVNIQGWFPLEWTGLISLQSRGL